MRLVHDRLFLLRPGFEDPAYPGQHFYCSDCVLMEGLLASFPQLGVRLEIDRVPFARPRREVVALVGEANQNLPLLVLADDAPDRLAEGSHNGVRFVADRRLILEVLSARHGYPLPHP